MDNQKPVFYIKDFHVESARTMGAGNAHLKLKFQRVRRALKWWPLDKVDGQQSLLKQKT